MSVATFSQDLKVFSADDDYSSPVSVSLCSSNQNHGRITWSGDGKWLTVAPLDQGGGPLPVFKYADKQLQPLRYVTLSNIASASFFNWTNRYVAVGNEKGELFVWDLKEKKIGTKVEYVEKQSVDFVAVNSEDAYIASGSLTSNKICIHGLKTNKVVNTISVPKSNHTSSLKFSMCKKNFLGVSSIESTICVWDIVKSDFVFRSVNSHFGACKDISFSPINCDVIASVSLTKTLKMYDIRDRKSIFETNIGEPMNCVDIILNGDKVALGTTGGSVIIYDLRCNQVFHSFKAHEGLILSIKTQNLKIPKSYQDVEMNTPDVVDNPSKTLDISVMDIFSPISTSAGKDASNGLLNQSKIVSIHSTPKIIFSNSANAYEDSFFKKLLSPQSQPKMSIVPTSQSSPYLCPIKEKSDVIMEPTNIVSEQPNKGEECNDESITKNGCGDGGGGGGDGFHVDNNQERNLYYSDIISEIRNCQKEVLKEINSVKKEVSEMKTNFNAKFQLLEENFENLSNLLLGDIKQEIYAGNCDSKIEHISQRILINELNETLLASGEKVSEQIRLNGLRLKHIFELLNGVKL